ncbi:MAG: discoidin domain-containing protein, partial [Clostridia bacterium]|nr:discoidin domain-containing protein [Clostridia bacterium]
MKKLISIALCLVMLMASVVALIPEMATEANAATYRTAWNGASSSYKSSKYYEHYTRIPLTGDGVTDTLALALSQLGYHEGASTSDMDGISSSNGNYTEFNYNMGSAYTGGYTYEWCATFCSWALYQARQTDHGSGGTYKTLCRYNKGNSAYIWREIGCGHWVNNLKSAGIWKYSQAYGGSYKPQPGDLIFFRSAAHIGMVVYSDSSYVYTVEGNTSDAAGVEPAGGGVFFKKYALSSSSLDGYGHLPYKVNSSVKKIDYSGANPTTGLYISNAVKYVYSSATSSTVSYNMPRFTMFEVTEIASNGRLKATYKTSSGTTVTGWILNNTDRVIQLTSNAEPVNMTLKCVDDKGTTIKTQTITGNKGATGTITPPAIDGYVCTQSSVSVTYVSGGTVTLTYKTILDSAIDNARGVRYCDYTPGSLASLRSAYSNAVAMQSNASATSAQKIAAANALNSAVADTIYKGESVVSVGATYTTTATERTDKWKDDGKRLTDGVKNKIGNTEGYAGWAVGAEGGNVEVIVDLGATVSSNIYRIYTSVNSEWGINTPNKLTVSVSTDKKTWTEVGSTDSETATVSGESWQSYYMTIRTDVAQTARYVKFVVNAPAAHAWLEEVEVASSPLGAMGEIYIDGINTYVQAGRAVIFTPAFGTLETKTANHSWTLNVLVEWDNTDKVYVVKSVSNGTGSNTPSVTLKEGQLMIACHSWENNVTDPIYRSVYNRDQFTGIEVGDKLYISNIDVATGKIGAAATVSWVSLSGYEPEDPSTNVPQNIALNKGYTTSGIYVANGEATYPDENGKTLTDGLNATADSTYAHPAFVGFNKHSEEYDANGYATITVDLGAEYDLNKFIAHFASAKNSGAGVTAPAKVTVYVSDDKSSWTSVG